jgi:hypothetical protein
MMNSRALNNAYIEIAFALVQGFSTSGNRCSHCNRQSAVDRGAYVNGMQLFIYLLNSDHEGPYK